MFQHRRTRSIKGVIRTAAGVSIAASAAILAVAVSAQASSLGTVGQATASGQVVGKLTAPQMSTASDGLTQYGCQISPNSQQQLIVNFTPVDLRIGGKGQRASDISLSLVLTKDGNKESLAPVRNSFDNGVSVSLRAGGKLYAWSSISGTVRSNASGRSGAFNAELLPEGNKRLVQAPRTSATQPIHLTGTWMGCHPGVA